MKCVFRKRDTFLCWKSFTQNIDFHKHNCENISFQIPSLLMCQNIFTFSDQTTLSNITTSTWSHFYSHHHQPHWRTDSSRLNGFNQTYLRPKQKYSHRRLVRGGSGCGQRVVRDCFCREILLRSVWDLAAAAAGCWPDPDTKRCETFVWCDVMCVLNRDQTQTCQRCFTTCSDATTMSLSDCNYNLSIWQREMPSIWKEAIVVAYEQCQTSCTCLVLSPRDIVTVAARR